MTYLYILIASSLVALLCAGLLAFLETSFTALRLFKLKELQAAFHRQKSVFGIWEKNPQRIFITILVANNFAHVVCSVLLTEIMQKVFGVNRGLILGAALATIVLLVFGEIIPKSWAKSHHERLFVSSLWIVNVLLKVFHPMVVILGVISNFFVDRVSGKSHDMRDMVTEKEIEFLIDYSDEQGIMETGKTEMLQNIFDLGTKVAYDIIIPKNDMVCLDVSYSLEKAMTVFSESRFSRLPVYEGKEDNIIGIIYQKDIFTLLSKNNAKSLKELVRNVLFVPETKRINQLLSEFLEKRMHMAIVIDEYGSVSGLVTLEDVIEEIVGDIRDEDEREQAEMVRLEKGGWIVDGRMNLDKLEEILEVSLDVDDSVTVSGFMTEKLQHLPRKGERISYGGYCFQIQQASRRRVFQVLIFKETTEE